jgi:WD40 repeat protein
MSLSWIKTVCSVAGFAFVQSCAQEVTPPIQGLDAQLASSVSYGDWSAPVNLGSAINSAGADQTATLSKDQLSLYFASVRAGGFGNFDIYVSRRATIDSPWEPAKNLGAMINGPGPDFAANLSIDGHLLFFSSNKAGGAGSTDIYVAHRSNTDDDLSWSAPVLLGAGVNTPDAEQAPMFLQSAEDGPGNLYFNRGVNAANGADIYMAAITRDGEVREAAVLVTELSLAGINDAAVSIRKDGKELFFWSGALRPGGVGLQDVWTSTRRSVHEPWSAPTNVGAPINSTANDFSPTLSFDASTLVFSSDRLGGLGGTDIWMSTRPKQ